MNLNPGDLCRVRVDYLKTGYDFIGVFIGADAKRYPWYNIRFLHPNGGTQVFALLKSEIKQFVEVVNEAR